MALYASVYCTLLVSALSVPQQPYRRCEAMLATLEGSGGKAYEQNKKHVVPALVIYLWLHDDEKCELLPDCEVVHL